MKKPKPPKMKTATPTVVTSGSETAKPAATTAEAQSPKKAFNPFALIREVRQEARRITWPTGKETWITTVMVVLMVIVASIFFFLVDSSLGALVNAAISLLSPR